MERNSVVHFEMPYEDEARVCAFYEAAFGWKMNQLGAAMGDYVVAHTTKTDEENMVTTPGHINGGFYPLSASPTSKEPSVVISVPDINAAIERVKTAGGEVLGEPMEIPGIGQYVSCTDTEGNRVGMLQPSSGT